MVAVLIGKHNLYLAERVIAANAADVDAPSVEESRVHLVAAAIDVQIVVFEYRGTPNHYQTDPRPARGMVRALSF
jgi:hypothetical protein